MKRTLTSAALGTFLLLAACSATTTGQSLYALDQAYATAATTAASAINSGIVKDAATVAKIKAASQAAHDALKAASQAEAANPSTAGAAIAAAEAAIADFNNILVVVK